MVDRQRHGEVGARPDRQVQVGQPRERRLARIDDDQGGAATLGLADDRHEVDAGRRRVRAPHHDQLRMGVVGIGDARHLPVERLVGGARGGGAHGARQPRRAEPPEERRVGRVLREQPVRAAVAEGQDGLGAAACRRLSHAQGDEIERLVPVDTGERTGALAAAPGQRAQEPVLAVDAPVVPADLRADEPAGRRLRRRAVDRHDPATLDGDRERTGVGTVERARRLDGGLSPRARRRDVGHGFECSEPRAVTQPRRRRGRQGVRGVRERRKRGRRVRRRLRAGARAVHRRPLARHWRLRRHARRAPADGTTKARKRLRTDGTKGVTLPSWQVCVTFETRPRRSATKRTRLTKTVTPRLATGRPDPQVGRGSARARRRPRPRWRGR